MNNRRKFLGTSVAASLAAFFGFKPEKTEASVPIIKAPDTKRGVCVFYINIGNLPPFKAEAFMERLKDNFKKAKKVDSAFESLFIPTRTDETRVEIFEWNGKTLDKIEASHIFKPILVQDETEVPPGTLTKWKDDAINLTMMLLGAPVLKVELDEETLVGLFDQAWNTVERYRKSKETTVLDTFEMRQEYTQRGLLAYSYVALGHIRSKYQNPPGPGGTLQMNGKELLDEGQRLLNNWHSELGAL